MDWERVLVDVDWDADWASPPSSRRTKPESGVIWSMFSVCWGAAEASGAEEERARAIAARQIVALRTG